MSDSTSESHPVLNEKQVAQRLGVSPITVLRLRQRGELSYYRIGGRIVFSVDQINDFLKRAEKKAWVA